MNNIAANVPANNAILGLDVVQFSLLPIEDQTATIQFLVRSVREALANHDIGTSDYRWSPAGDGGYLTFLSEASAVLAVEVAFSLREKIRRPRWRPKQGTPIELKIVLHYGETVELTQVGGEPNVSGDGLNAAERMLMLCAPGQVLMSRTYFETYEKYFAQEDLEIGEVHWRTVKHGVSVAVMNVTRFNLALTDSAARAVRWQPIANAWERARTEYRQLAADAILSGEPVPALAAARYLLDMADNDAVQKICQSIGRSATPATSDQPRTPHPIFGLMPPEVLFDVIAASKPVQHHAGDVLCQTGDPSNNCYFPIAGTVLVHIDGAPEPKVVPPGRIIGEFALWIPGIGRTATLTCQDDVLLLDIEIAGFAGIMNRSPDVADAIYHVVQRRIVENLSEGPLFPAAKAEIQSGFDKGWLRCQRVPAGSKLALRDSVFILYSGRVGLQPADASPLQLSAAGRPGSEKVIGIALDDRSPDGAEATVEEDSVVISIPRTTLDSLFANFAEMRERWTELCDSRIGRIARRNPPKPPGSAQSLQVSNPKHPPADLSSVATTQSGAPMTDTALRKRLRDLFIETQTIAKSLDDLILQRNQGSVDLGRFMSLWQYNEKKRLAAMMELEDLLGGRDDEFDSILEDARRGSSPETDPSTQDKDLRERLVKVVESKGLGRQLAEKISQHRGAIAAWVVEVGIAIAKHFNAA